MPAAPTPSVANDGDTVPSEKLIKLTTRFERAATGAGGSGLPPLMAIRRPIELRLPARLSLRRLKFSFWETRHRPGSAARSRFGLKLYIPASFGQSDGNALKTVSAVTRASKKDFSYKCEMRDVSPSQSKRRSWSQARGGRTGHSGTSHCHPDEGIDEGEGQSCCGPPFPKTTSTSKDQLHPLFGPSPRGMGTCAGLSSP